MSVHPLPTPSAPPVAGPYSPAVRAGDWIVLSGQLGFGVNGALVGGGTAAQAGQALANVAAVLADCGASWGDVAKVALYLTDISEFPGVNAVYEGALGAHRPARTTVAVAGLPAGASVEIECWAYLPESRRAGRPE